ncbi:MAG TPA: hypothetical protein VFM34_06580 [Moraxellaceae bacterium]|nr:hypothetical protein [Moraxellaceae bacterium]
MTHASFLAHLGHRYLKLAVGTVLVSTLAYLWHDPSPRPGGGTWLGYLLGTVGALLIVWLTAYGVRKRAYASSLGTLRGWLSAHVYLGTALVVIATLHTGFQVGWNVHTLAYVLTLAVVLSGFWGLYLYLVTPDRLNSALSGETLEQHLLAITAIDNDCRNLAMNHVDHVNRALLDSLGAPLFRHYGQQLAGRNPGCRTAAVVAMLDAGVAGLTEAQLRVNGDIYRLQLQKLARLNRLRRYLHLRTWLDLWLLVHVPLAIALLAALGAHILSVFYYW